MDVLLKERDYCYERLKNYKSLNDFLEIGQQFFYVFGDAHISLDLFDSRNMIMAPIETDIIEGVV